jgi:hypothetical protein
MAGFFSPQLLESNTRSCCKGNELRTQTSTQFHELAHVEQYRQLGIPQFSELYVRGFLNGGSYEAIPLEVNAHTLEGRFEANHHQRFSVEGEVRKCYAES